MVRLLPETKTVEHILIGLPHESTCRRASLESNNVHTYSPYAVAKVLAHEKKLLPL